MCWLSKHHGPLTDTQADLLARETVGMVGLAALLDGFLWETLAAPLASLALFSASDLRWVESRCRLRLRLLAPFDFPGALLRPDAGAPFSGTLLRSGCLPRVRGF